MGNGYIKLTDLEIYKLARELSRAAWDIYAQLDTVDRKIMGDQFIRSIDSVGANIAEGYRRYHYLDKIRFYYTARGSLAETCQHWLGLLYERNKVSSDTSKIIMEIESRLSVKLANMISATYQKKETLSSKSLTPFLSISNHFHTFNTLLFLIFPPFQKDQLALLPAED